MRRQFAFPLFIFLLIGGLSKVRAQQTDSIGTHVPKPIFKNGQAQIVPEFSSEEDWIKEELWVETSFDSDNDGKLDRMHVFVTRPKQTESRELKLPVIYTSSPYYGLKISTIIRQAVFSKSKIFWKVKHEIGELPKSRKHSKLGTRIKRPLMSSYMDNLWVPRGYIMVYSSSPGTGLSDGAITMGGENESLAPKAVIDWLCGRAKGFNTRNGNEEVAAFWSTGKVGMTGTSYDGTICIAAATTGVEGLEAIIPVAPLTSHYHYYRSNGLVKSPGGYIGEDMDVYYDYINTGDKSNRKHNDATIRDSLLALNIDRITGDYNDFWDSRDYLNKIDYMHAAMLMAHGFNDWNVMPEQSYRFYKAAKEKGLPVQLYYHQGGHGGDPPFKMMNRWFTRYLHGIENGVENDPPVWIVRENSNSPKSYSSFPDSNSSNVILHLKSGNNGTGHLYTEKPDQQNTETLSDDYSINYSELHKSKNASHRLLYLSPVLQKSIRISGVATVTIRLACNKPAANLSVYLITLPWIEGKHVKIYENLITRSWADPQNHKSIRKGEPLIPGEYVQVSFDLMPDDQIIPEGKQIGLMIFSSDQEFTLCPKSGTQLTIDLNSTSITLPVVGGITAYENAVKNSQY
ncbi:MAG: Xaa-Pro dipeptidyl-peptidase [Crocinitomicaceae bacterium]|nr:Xaa-Pro dipeptidyl-peptidase [Crocinitomicaceae bacterium]MBK8924734.1 Xaa-Pro dipeptidyl-peptidase [Crocinitomicaceae bacterium]